MLFFPLFQAQENGRWSRGVATSFSLTWWSELTKIPRSPEIKSIDIRPKRFHYKQACVQDGTCWRFLHDVLMSGAHHLLMYDKRWAGFGEKKGEWACGRDCAWHKARLLSLAIESQIYNKWRRRHKKVKPFKHKCQGVWLLAPPTPPPPHLDGVLVHYRGTPSVM